MTSWLEINTQSDFSIHNIPFGIYSSKSGSKQLCSAIGDQIIDLKGLHELGIFHDLNINPTIWSEPNLNSFISLGKSITTEVRNRIQSELCNPDSTLKSARHVFHNVSDVQMHLPVHVGDYTDFYSSIEHATNVGTMFRDPENALLPNWRHLPVGYHGRASSIVVSDTDIRRPKGQTVSSDSIPSFGPSRLLDFELEMAFVIGKESQLGSPIPIEKTSEHIFGMVLFNDWSARDIQKWEYVPLGPFLAKSFASSVSPWLVTMEALEFAKVDGPKQTPGVLPYLQSQERCNYDINLSVGLTPKGREESIICNSNFKYMYWNMQQQLAHHTSNGCNVRVGDMMASGTISGPTESSYGSMLELSWAGKKEIQLSNGETRKFLQDYDRITMKGYAERDGKRVGFGAVSSQILPSL